jgi:hypothetical protein
MSLNLAHLIQLQSKIDSETAKLLGKFLAEALKAPDTNTFVKQSLRAALVEAGIDVE